ncbi:LysR family transcriptional regulator [Pararobbsia silviterrae]|uniref:LysR family transcriptional regulator n=1 Tax=Pararobbsia silviterrae TaxID=1792498 RepID=A0A494XMG8_9BURK|nr:LysR family transcriptional regulator [Pararobbsia silviterrae]RKP51818.1 LysR family transcriptional regulator [Pararobbsia silviterrae]
MVRLEDLVIFVSAADRGSLSAAARQLDVSPAVASAALKRLEAEVGARLLARSTRSLRLSPDGERYLKFARGALAEVEAGRMAVARGRQTIGGELSLSIPSDLGRHVLIEWLDEFQARHRDVRLQIHIGDRVADMFKESVDVAVRYGVPEDSTLIVLPLAHTNRRVLVASPAYLARYGRPEHPDDLAHHNCLRFALSETVHSRWTFRRGEQSSVVTVDGDRVSDDGEIVRRWAVMGHGIAYKSRIDVLEDVRAGRLEAILSDYEAEVAPLNLVCAHRLMLSPTVNALRELLVERVQRYLSAG